MTIAFDRVQKPLRQLRRSLTNLTANPAPEQVHRLRTRARQIEAIAAALSSGGEKLTRRLLKSIKPLRKAAGAVRDMDVLAAKARTLQQQPDHEALTRLIEHLKLSRKKSATKLLAVLDVQKKPARQHLKLYAKQLEVAKDSASFAGNAKLEVHAAAEQLAAELNRWPTLGARNLHNYRLKVKQLRSVLQLLSGADHALTRDSLTSDSLIDVLGVVKDKIGEWHDWQQLARTAVETLNLQQDRALVSAIKEVAKLKLQEALAAANKLRGQTLLPGAKKPPAPERELPAGSVTARPSRIA